MTRRRRKQAQPQRHRQVREGRQTAPPDSSSEQDISLVDLVAENPSHRRELREMFLYHFSGPLPPPEVLRQYDELIPGFSRTLLDNWRDQSEHRMGLEKAVVESNIRQARHGLYAGIVVSLAGLSASVALGWAGAEIAAGVVGGSTLASLAGAFLYGTRARTREREEKQEIMSRSRDL